MIAIEDKQARRDARIREQLRVRLVEDGCRLLPELYAFRLEAARRTVDSISGPVRQAAMNELTRLSALTSLPDLDEQSSLWTARFVVENWVSRLAQIDEFLTEIGRVAGQEATT
jgi:hypothetical protein